MLARIDEIGALREALGSRTARWRSAGIASLRSAPGDLAAQLDASLVGRDTGAVHPAAVRADAAPDHDQGPVAEQILVEEDMVVPGLLGVDPGALCRRGAHAGRRRQPAGLSGESAARCLMLASLPGRGAASHPILVGSLSICSV